MNRVIRIKPFNALITSRVREREDEQKDKKISFAKDLNIQMGFGKNQYKVQSIWIEVSVVLAKRYHIKVCIKY